MFEWTGSSNNKRLMVLRAPQPDLLSLDIWMHTTGGRP